VFRFFFLKVFQFALTFNISLFKEVLMVIKKTATLLIGLSLMILVAPLAKGNWNYDTSPVNITFVKVVPCSQYNCVWFGVSKMPANPPTGCSLTDGFYISPGGIPDANVRNTFYATVLGAQTTGRQVLIGYDGSSTGCDTNGRPKPAAVNLCPIGGCQ
jgi:hypothetical protein